MANGLGLRKLSVNVVATLGRQLGSGLLQLVLMAVIARAYGPSGNGAYSVALLLPMLLSSFLNLGVGPANVYFLGAGLIHPRVAWKRTLKIYVLLCSLGLAIGAGVIFIFGTKWFPGLNEDLLWVSLLVFPFSLLLALVSSFFQGLQEFKKFNLALLLQPFATLLLTLLIIIAGFGGLYLLVVAYLVGVVLTLAVAVRQLLPMLGEVEQNSNESVPLLSYGLKSHLSNIITFLNYKTDLFLINYFVGPLGAGIYVVAVQLVEKLWVLSTAVSAVLLPRLSQLSSDERRKSMLTPLICRWVLLFTFVASLILLAVAPTLIELVFGTQFEGAFPVLAALVPGIVLWAGGRVLANDIASRGKPEITFYISIAVLVTNVTLNFMLIPLAGLVGAGIATSVAYFLDFLAKLLVYVRLTGNKWVLVVFVIRDDVRLLKSSMAVRVK